MEMFRTLNKDEETEFRQWAKDNWKPGDEIKNCWHPVVRDECNNILMYYELEQEGIQDKETNSCEFCSGTGEIDKDSYVGDTLCAMVRRCSFCDGTGTN
jgi:hypothetical protein